MGREAEKIKERTTGAKDAPSQSEASGVTSRQGVAESDVEQDVETEKAVNLDYNIRENGTIGLTFEVRTEYDIAYRLGKIGGLLVILGMIVSLVAPILYIVDIIPTLAHLIGIMGLPFTAGGGLMKLSDSFEYFPGA